MIHKNQMEAKGKNICYLMITKDRVKWSVDDKHLEANQLDVALNGKRGVKCNDEGVK